MAGVAARNCSHSFGILAFVWPVITLLTLSCGEPTQSSTAFLHCGVLSRAHAGIRVCVSGLSSSVLPVSSQGLLAFAWPGVTALVLLFFIAIWAIVIGVMQIWGAIQLRKEMEGEWLLILSGLLSVALGILLLARPGLGRLRWSG